MSDFLPYPQNQKDSSKGGTDDFTTKVLIPLGSIIVGAIGLWASTNRLPALASWIMATYLVIVLVKILASPVKSFASKAIVQFDRNRFAKKMRPELFSLMGRLNELLDRQRTIAVPYFIGQVTQRLSNDIRSLESTLSQLGNDAPETKQKISNNVSLSIQLNHNLREFQILQSWSHSLLRPRLLDRNFGFWGNAADLTSVAAQFAWACSYFRQDIDVIKNSGKFAAQLSDLKPDWDVAAQKVSLFMSDVERFAKSVNKKYGTDLCVASFQEVKPL